MEGRRPGPRGGWSRLRRSRAAHPPASAPPPCCPASPAGADPAGPPSWGQRGGRGPSPPRRCCRDPAGLQRHPQAPVPIGVGTEQHLSSAVPPSPGGTGGTPPPAPSGLRTRPGPPPRSPASPGIQYCPPGRVMGEKVISLYRKSRLPGMVQEVLQHLQMDRRVPNHPFFAHLFPAGLELGLDQAHRLGRPPAPGGAWGAGSVGER